MRIPVSRFLELFSKSTPNEVRNFPESWNPGSAQSCEEMALSSHLIPGSFGQKCRLSPPEFSESQKLKVLEGPRFHFSQNRPLNRLLSLRNPGFVTSREVTKRTISTLPATSWRGPCGTWKTAVFRCCRQFPAKAQIQAALAYTPVSSGRDPGFQPGWHPEHPGSGSREPGSRVPGALDGPDPGCPGPPRRPWEGLLGPSRPSWAGQPRSPWTWILSNTSPGSSGDDPGDRARSTEDAGTLSTMLSSGTTSSLPSWAP